MNPPASATTSPRMKLIEQVMHELNPLQQDIVRLLISFDEDAPDEWLAARHGVTVGRVKVERSVARMKIHVLFRKREAASRPPFFRSYDDPRPEPELRGRVVAQHGSGLVPGRPAPGDDSDTMHRDEE